MVPFEVFEARDVSEACSLAAEHGSATKVIAGGQNLLVLLRQRLIKPRYLIDVKGCSGMDYIEEDKEAFKLGALTTHRTVETSELISEKLPMLAELERELGCVQSRNWGTIGGNICRS